MPNEVDASGRRKSSWIGIQLTLHRIKFNRKTASGVLFIVAIFAFVPLWTWQNWDLLILAGFQAAFGVAASLLINPVPIERDLSTPASVSMQRIMDTYGYVEEARKSITDLSIEAEKNGHDYISRQLIHPQNLLWQQSENFARSLDDWEDLAPGTKEQLIEKQRRRKANLEDLMKEKPYGRA